MLQVEFDLDDGSGASLVTIIDRAIVERIDPSLGPYLLDPLPPRIVIFAPQDGYWDVMLDTSGRSKGRLSIIFKAIGVSRTTSWWQSLHGMISSRAGQATGARIGIIDEALELQTAASCIRHIRNIGGDAWGQPHAARAITPMTDHGHAVCSLVGSRATVGKGSDGVAAQAQIVFAAAGSDGAPDLDVPRLVACIDTLVDDYECDVLSVSAGDWNTPLESLEIQVEEAADKGTLCFFAAGNRAAPLYPARYPVCLGVAALGQYRSAPPDTLVAFHNNHLSDPLMADTYLWRRSAHGPAIEFCSPGVGVIWNRDGHAARGAVGTSYACPIASGIAALILGADAQFLKMPRNRERYDYGVGVLSAHCRPFGVVSEGNLWKYGRLWIP